MCGEQMPLLAVILWLRCPGLSSQIHTAAPGNLDDGWWTCARLLAEVLATGRRDHPETPADIVGRSKTQARVASFKSSSKHNLLTWLAWRFQEAKTKGNEDSFEFKS